MIRDIHECSKEQGIVMSTKRDFNVKEKLLAVIKGSKEDILGEKNGNSIW